MLGAMLHEAWRAMGANRLRTLLTMLGMVIGVGAVVLMMAIGQGAQHAVAQTISSMGSNIFVILSGYTSTGGVRSGKGTEDFSGLRTHQPADSPRHVAWKAVAREQPLLTKQFAGTSTAQVWLDWNELPTDLGVEARLSRLLRSRRRQPPPDRSPSGSASCRARWCAAWPPRKASTSPS